MNHAETVKRPQPSNQKRTTERSIPADIYPAIDTDLARDNLENDLTAADLEEL